MKIYCKHGHLRTPNTVTLTGYCVPCKNKSARKARRRYTLKKYGITPLEYDQLSENQGHKCAICRQHSVDKKLSVDHDHKTNTIRGLLCYACNVALGFLEDDVNRLEAAINYLKSSYLVK